MAESASPAAPAPAPAPPSRRRGRETARDMVLSLAVVGLVVGFLVVVNLRPTPDPVRVVDPAPAVAQAQDEAPFVPVVPVGLPVTWQPTSARFEGAAVSSVANVALWHVGYVTPTGAYAGLDQGATDPGVLVRSVMDGARQVGEGTGAFVGWQHWRNGDGSRQAYALQTADSTVVVSGTADDAELTTLKQSLRPAPTP